MARWYMDRFFGIEKKLLKLIRPVAESVTKIPMPTEEVMDNIEELYINLSRIKDILEGDSTTVRLVSVPEKMVIRETQRAYTYLNLFGYNVDLMVINKVIPELEGGYLTEWRKIQEKYLDTMANIFPIPKKYVKLYQQEVYGLDLLRKVGEEIYGGEDPLTRYVQERPMRLFKKNGEYVLSLRVPFAKKEEIDIMKRGDELIIITKNWKRILFLPQVLSGKEAVGATFTDGRLEITFNEKVI
jgi:arsenite-transporting ATPase